MTGTVTESAWKIAWNYPLNQFKTSKGAVLVPNMVSLAAGDYDKDGIDDLAVTWGYFGSGSEIQPSRATIMMGADNSQMMTRSYTFDLKSGGTDIYRASFTAGDVDNDGYNELVMGGSLANSDRNSRYLAIYEWSDSGFSIVAEQNFDLFEEENGVRTWRNIEDEDTYYSVPLAPANVAVGKFYGMGTSPCIYLDSIIIEYGSDGFQILDLLSKEVFPTGQDVPQYYVEWGARAADTTGDGQDILLTMSNAVMDHTDFKTLLDFLRVYSFSDYKNQYKLSGVRFDKGADSYSASCVLEKIAEFEETSNFRTNASLSFSLPNTDSDTMLLKYTGEHYYTYSDPEVLAVLASPPYYADLANGDDDSQMIESSTAYGTTKGSGGGTTYSNSFSVGVYTSWEKTFKIFNVELFSAEAEFSINNTFTWETQKTSSLEYEVEYATMAGVDTVVLYSMPIESYVYEAQIPNEAGGYDTQLMTVNIPYEPSIQTISLENYNKIYNTYKDMLPDVSCALTHTVGDPSSYASSISNLPGDRTQTLVYDGNPFTIGQGSQNTQSQSIAMTNEEENSFNYQLDVETKFGVGGGGVMVGVTAGYSHGAGSVHISTAGSSYTATMNGLPTQAEQYGYSFNWKLVGFLYQGKYPVVTYLVTNVKEPPLLPENFGTDEDHTTTEQIALEWDYSGNAAGFILYRFFQSPSASGYYKIATIEAGEGTPTGSGRHYTYIDTGLSPNTAYQYRIQTIGMSQPNTSIPSEAYTTYTKPESGVPVVAVSSETLAAHPDTVVWVAANITNQSELTGALIYYQWQKQTAKGSWEDITGETENTLTFRYPNVGVEGVYRCKVSALTNQNLVTAYSPEVTVTYAQREAVITEVTVDQTTGKLTATVKGVDVDTIPAGTVSFNLGTDITYTAQLDASGVATVTVNPANGVYKITADYSGSKVFLPASYDDPDNPLFYAKGITTSQSYIDVKDTYTYGDAFNFVRYTVNADGEVVNSESYIPNNNNNWTFGSDNFVGQDGNINFVNAVKDRFNSGYAGWVGPVTFSYETGSGTRTVRITIQPKDAVLTGLEDVTKSITEVRGPEQTDALLSKELFKKLTLEGYVDWNDDDATSDTPFGIALMAVDAAGNEIHYGSETGFTVPGAYTLSADRNTLEKEIGIWAPGDSPANYNIAWPTAKLFVTGETYPVSAEVKGGESAYGSVSVSSPAGATQAAVGQTVIFRAVPNDGYEVAGWTMNDTPIENSVGQNTLTTVQTTAGANAVVSFRTKQNTLTVTALPASPTVGGAPVTNAVEANEDSYFENGNAYATGAEITFTPKAAEGWHFTGWEYHVSGQSPQYSDAATFTVTMPDASVQLYAKFERDTYQLTLGDNLTAYVNDEPVADLTAITGDTEVTVKPATGYSLAADAQWLVNDVEQAAEDDGTCKFSITEDTIVTAEVEAQTYTVTLNEADPEGSGTAEATATGSVTGGTSVTFTAVPNRGYDFAKWTDDEGTEVSTSASYTVTIGKDLTLTPVFTAQTGKNVAISAEDGGSIDWAIDGVDADESSITVYPGETLKLTATPDSGRMVAGWTVNGSYDGNDYSKEKTFAYKDLKDDNTISVTFKPVTYFTVKFVSDLTATADGETIQSGALVAAGSRMEFTYTGTGEDTVTKWLNGETELPFAKTLVIDPLTGNLDISVEIGELQFFFVKDSNEDELKNYTATVTGTYEGTGDDAGKYAKNTLVSLTVIPLNDYQITDVDFGEAEFTLDEDTGAWTGTVEKITEDIIFTVTVEEKQTPPTPGTTYTVTFDPNGGTLTGASTAETDEDGTLGALPGDPTREGYTFDGWYTAKTDGDKVDTDRVYSEDTTLYAHWTEESSGDNTGGGGGGSSSGSGGSSGGSGGSSGGSSLSTYAITIAETKNGNVTASAKTAAKGDSVTLTVDPDQGYTLDTLTVTDKNGDQVKLTEKSGKYTFTMPASKVTVKATFAEVVTEPENPFVDVADDAYYFDAVLWAAENGITGGTDATHFSPNATCTRAQAVTFLWRAAGSPAPKSSVMTFTDVAEGSYYHDAVLWAVENGITKGTSDTTFSPNAECTRAQIVTFLWRSQKSPAADSVNPFTDVAADAYYAGAVLWAAENGITGGTTATTFSPSNDCTRAQIVTFLFRCLG